MPKIKTNRVRYPNGWELIEPTLRELEEKMRQAENDPHDGRRKCEALWPIFNIAHQKSRYIYDLFYRRNEISQELYEFCLDQGRDMNAYVACNASSHGTTISAPLAYVEFPRT
ncbi:protein BUD31 homolog 2-like [Papaver somniferum]|uniref:protein BUD31 homolog 2-like n=1 Tax=Papaver somniferum TaxID=3469 RepID=UPI000E6FDE15|nr:protein BUD31 homolog 2-like [Papaver somniferum]